ncbi:phage tail tip lysozyme [Carnobacterium divergens]|uniref:phage tail tip lysozyme n=1 Tax=Carnobacterium divergens TaxID=2748 RepID=UPI0039AF1013
MVENVTENAKAIYLFFRNKGWTAQAISGLLGNMQGESGIIADKDELGGGGGYGLVQWTPKSNLVNWANSNGLNYRTVETQCKRIQWELENGKQFYATTAYPLNFRQFTQSTQSPTYLASVFIHNYERPANPNQPQRGIWAEEWFNLLSDTTEKPLDPKRNFGVKISYFLENEVLEKLTEFRSAFPQYSACLEYAENQKYSIVIQPFTYLEVNAKKMEIQGKFPHWTMAVAELVDFSTRKALLIAPFKGVEVGEAFLKTKKRFGFSMTINPSPYGDAGRVDYSKELNKNSIVVSPFSSGEALDKLNEFKKAFPSYAANTFLEQRLENAEQYHLVIQPFAPVEVKDALNEINGRFPSWMKNIQAFHNVGDPKAILISPFTGSEVTEKYLLVKKEFGYSMEIVDV